MCFRMQKKYPRFLARDCNGSLSQRICCSYPCFMGAKIVTQNNMQNLDDLYDDLPHHLHFANDSVGPSFGSK